MTVNSHRQSNACTRLHLCVFAVPCVLWASVCVFAACLPWFAPVTFPLCSNSPDVRAALFFFISVRLSDWHIPPAVSSSEQPDPVQVLLTPNLEEEEDQAVPNQDAALGPDPPPPPYRPAPPRPPFTLNIAHPCAPSGRGEQEKGGCVGRRGEEGEDGREGTGVRLCELLQAGGVSVRPLGKHLAISLPSLPLRLWDTHTTHTAHSSDLEPPHTHPPPPPPPSSPPPSHPLEPSGQRKSLVPMWQSPQPHPQAGAAQHWPRHDANSDSNTRHLSSWSLDRPDAVVTPYDTPPDRCVPIRPQYYSYSCQASSGHCCSQRATGQHGEPCCDREEAELSELDSLYQASLQAGRTGTLLIYSHVYLYCICFDQVCAFSGCSPSERLISRVGGQARSKTPNADMERSVYGADCTSTPTYLSKVTPTFISVCVTQSLLVLISH